jgi:hypothetical protein
MLARLLPDLRVIKTRRVAFGVQYLDRLLCVLKPSNVTLDAAAACVARAIWAEQFAWSPLRVERHGQRLVARSVRWPTGWKVKDAPWTAIAALEKLNIGYVIAPNAEVAVRKRLGNAGIHIATATIAGTSVSITATNPKLVENMGLPALTYAGSADSGRYRLPLLAAEALLDEPSILISDSTRKAILAANTTVKPIDPPEGFPWTLYGFQRRDLAQAERIVATTGGVLLAGTMGTGKALDVATLVYTPDGPVRIGELSTGARVLGSDGYSHEVTGVFDQGERLMFRVLFSDGTSLRADAEHLWAVTDTSTTDTSATDTSATAQPTADTSATAQVLSTAQLAEGQLLNADGTPRWELPLVKPLQFRSTEPLVLPAYTLGVLLGVGVGRDRDTVPSSLNTQLFASCMRDLEEQCWPGGSVRGALGELGVFDRAAALQVVPSAYLFAPPAERVALLQGLFDGAASTGTGCTRPFRVHGAGLVFHSVSKQVCDGMAWLVQSLGGTATPEHGETFQGVAQVSVCLPVGVEPFRVVAPAGLHDPQTAPTATPTQAPAPAPEPSRFVVGVVADGSGHAVCISVDSPDRCFVAGPAVVTHNTTIALALAADLDAWPLLVVAPLAAFSTWVRQLAEMKRSAYLCTEPVRVANERLANEHFDAVIVSYDRLHQFTDVLESMSFAACFADEIQRIRTPGSRRSRALRGLAASMPVRVGLSGTPITNRVEDVLPLGAFLAPGEWKPRTTYSDIGELYPGADPVESLAEHLGTMMVRRRMEDTGVQLPDKHAKRVFVPLTADQRRALEDLEEEARAAAEEGDLDDRMHVFARLTKMRQIVNVPSAAGLSCPNPKIDAAVDLAEEYVSLGRKSIIFMADRAAYTEAGAELTARGIGWVGIWGSSSVPDRLLSEERFHNDDTVSVFIGTLAACSEALTLSPTATATIFAALSYSPSTIAQAAARAYRMNTTSEVDELYLHATAPGGTLDDRIWEILEIKRELAARVVDRTEHSDTTMTLSLEDLQYMVTGQRDNKASRRAAAQRDADVERERRRKHAAGTLYPRRTGEVHDDGSAALTREQWGAGDDPYDAEDELGGSELDEGFDESDGSDPGSGDEDFDVCDGDD